MFPQSVGEAAVQQHVCGVFDGCRAVGLAAWAYALGAGHLGEAAFLFSAPVCAGLHLRHRRALAPLPDVKVRFSLAKLFGGEGAAADVPFVLLVYGGAHPGHLGLELLELALLAGGGEGRQGDGHGGGQVEGLADRCHGGGQLASPGLPGRGEGGVGSGQLGHYTTAAQRGACAVLCCAVVFF